MHVIENLLKKGPNINLKKKKKKRLREPRAENLKQATSDRDKLIE